jgi:hypothetical protein
MRGLLVTAGLAAWCATLAILGAGDPARAQTTSALEQSIAKKRASEQSSGGAIKRLAALEAKLGREISIVQRRVELVEASYQESLARLDQTRTELADQSKRRTRMQARLDEGRDTLAAQLKLSYMTARPDLTTVVLDSGGVNDLLDRLEFERRVQQSNTRILELVRAARTDARTQSVRLTTLERRREDTTEAIGRQRASISQIRAALATRQAALSQARAARTAALKRTQGSRAKAERTLKRLEAARADAAVSSRGPGGPWAIPWAIVQCESGGQNLPPNSAGASGYYQFMPQTWQALGGSTPNAYQASKAEQDRLAAKLWRGGAGRSNWVCAGLVGA